MNVTDEKQNELNRGISSYPNASEQRPVGSSLDIKTPPTDLLQLYKEWVKYYSNRHGLYADRLDVAWTSLLADIERWKKALGQRKKNHLVCHHLFQFREFVSRAYNALVDSPQIPKADPTDVLDFRALVIGVFTAQWLLLQNVIAQRIDGSPYREGVHELDRIVMPYYARLYDVLTKQLDTNKLNPMYRVNPIAAFTPLVYLGNGAQLTVFNRRVPLMLRIPLGALPGSPHADKVQMAIPHEVSHAIFAQVPELIEEVKGKLKAEIQEGKLNLESNTIALSRREQTLYLMMVEWTEEICADLWGTALAGEKFAESARWTMADSASTTGITDATHPPAMLRPIIHLLALSQLEREKEKFEQTRLYFEQKIKESSSQFTLDLSLDRRFRSIPALMFVRMETVSDILNHLVKRMLELRLETLHNKTMGTLLSTIHDSSRVRLPHKELPKWGEDPQINSEEFILDFPADLVPAYTTPGIATLPDGSDIPFIRDLLNLIRSKRG